MSEETKKSTRKKLTGMFHNEGKYGEFWTGRDNKTGKKYVLELNQYKTEDKHPELVLFEVEEEAPVAVAASVASPTS